MTVDCPDARRNLAQVLGIVSDLDGTLLRSDGSLSPTTMSVLDTLTGLGVPLVVATALTPRALQKVSGHQRLGRAVCANGASIWDSGRDEVVRECCFDPSVLAALASPSCRRGRCFSTRRTWASGTRGRTARPFLRPPTRLFPATTGTALLEQFSVS